MVDGATKLTALQIPASVTKINDGNDANQGAFQDSGLTSIDLSTATGLATWKSGAGIGQDFGTFQGDTTLETVKLPLKLAQSGSIAQSAFNGCDKLTTIEFDFTTATGTNLDTLDVDVVTAFTNIYKMFAGGDDNFSNNGDLGTTGNKPAKTTWWLPVELNSSSSKTVTFNGITWTAKVAAHIDNDKQFTNDDKNNATSKLTSATQVTITGVVATGANKTLKYKYIDRNNSNHGPNLGANTNSSQTLPSNIKMIKITFNKGTVLGGRLARQ